MHRHMLFIRHRAQGQGRFSTFADDPRSAGDFALNPRLPLIQVLQEGFGCVAPPHPNRWAGQVQQRTRHSAKMGDQE